MKDEGGVVVRDQKNQDDIKNEVEDEKVRKHAEEKDALLTKLALNFSYMKHYLNCGLNILLYGVGSKRRFLNLFTMKYIVNEPTLVINGFHSAASMKSITNPMLNFAHRQKIQGADKLSTRSTQNTYD